MNVGVVLVDALPLMVRLLLPLAYPKLPEVPLIPVHIPIVNPVVLLILVAQVYVHSTNEAFQFDEPALTKVPSEG